MSLLRQFFHVDLPPDARRTYRFHLAYALFDAAAGGILLNAPVVALKLMRAPTWQLPLRELLAGVGILVALYLGGWMARRPKMPFVVVPGVLCVLVTLAMPLMLVRDLPLVEALGGAKFWFMALYGISAMFEIMARPAVATIIRCNYPATHRGWAAGEVRKWSSLAFAASCLATAAVLQLSDEHALRAAQALFTLAPLLSLAGFLCFQRIKVNEAAAPGDDASSNALNHFLAAASIFVRDARFRRYLIACFVDGFFGMLYLPLIWDLLVKTLEYDFLPATAMMHVIPSLLAFVVTGWLGRWFDRTNLWFSWAWIRFGWGFDALLLAVTPLAAAYFGPAAIALPLLGRFLKGSVQGGYVVLWRQIGVTHFAPPGGDTSRYMGIMTSLDGATRLTASAAGITLTWWSVQPTTLMAIGGVGIIAVGLYSLVEGSVERRQAHLATIADFEAQFTAPPPEADSGSARTAP